MPILNMFTGSQLEIKPGIPTEFLDHGFDHGIIVGASDHGVCPQIIGSFWPVTTRTLPLKDICTWGPKLNPSLSGWVPSVK